jgi:hypothetical protein
MKKINAIAFLTLTLLPALNFPAHAESAVTGAAEEEIAAEEAPAARPAAKPAMSQAERDQLMVKIGEQTLKLEEAEANLNDAIASLDGAKSTRKAMVAATTIAAISSAALIYANLHQNVFLKNVSGDFRANFDGITGIGGLLGAGFVTPVLGAGILLSQGDLVIAQKKVQKLKAGLAEVRASLESLKTQAE